MGNAPDAKCTSDAALAAAARSGDRRAAEALLARYEWLVRLNARGWRAAGWDEEDFEQEGRLGLWSAIGAYDPERGTAFEAYARHAVRNAVRDALRSARSRKHQPLGTALPLDDAPETAIRIDGPEPPSAIGAPPIFDRARALLTERQYQVVVSLCSGLSPKEAAIQLRMTHKQVYNAWQQALRAMRAHREYLIGWQEETMMHRNVKSRCRR